MMLATAYPMKVSESLFAAGEEDPIKAIDMINTLSIASMASKPSYPGPGTWLHGANRRLSQRMQARQPSLNLFLHDFGICDRYQRGHDAALAVRCPVTFVLGSRDQMTLPQSTHALAKALSAQVSTLNAGHSLMQEVPEQVLMTLQTFLRR
jgi:pimeloyl-ACP methyl ester carboxylesterase